MNTIKIMDIMHWIWRGKSVTRAFMNCFLKKRIVALKGTVIDLGGGGQPSYREVLSLPDTFFNMDRMEEAKPNFVADLERPLPLMTECADMVVLFNTLEHVFGYQHVVDEMYRIVKRGGRVLVYVPFMVNFHTYQGQGFFINDYFRYTRSALDRIFHQAGFERIEITPLGGLFWVLADILNIAARFRAIRWVVTIVCAFLEKLTLRFRRFDSTEKFPLGYFVEAYK